MGGKKSLIWSEIEKISGVYGGRELNRRAVIKARAVRPVARERGGVERGRQEVWKCLSLQAEGQLSPLGKGDGRAGRIGKEPEILLGWRM